MWFHLLYFDITEITIGSIQEIISTDLW
jgi:hypothetical protein